jgi:AbrB family looped-hinge helix DNA binding protein
MVVDRRSWESPLFQQVAAPAFAYSYPQIDFGQHRSFVEVHRTKSITFAITSDFLSRRISIISALQVNVPLCYNSGTLYLEVHMRQAKVRISDKGRVIIPAAFRDALGLKAGDEVQLRIEDNELRISTLRSRVREAQAYFRQFKKPSGRLSSAEFIQERREAAKHE